MTGPSDVPDPAQTMRQFLFGDAPLDEWVARGDGDPDGPWSSFERARQLIRAGQQQEAAQIWLHIATADGLETRHILQAWSFLRQVGSPPPGNLAKLALGAVAEMPVQGAHDVLAAYRDGTARYLNYSGKVLVWEDRTDPEVQGAINRWIATAQVVANTTGPWGKPLAPVPDGNARLMVLTPSGPHFGQGLVAPLSADPLAGAFLTAATSVLQLITSRAAT
jgi:hypothetical protein